MKDIIQNFNQIVDERCQCDVKHKLTDILILIMCATLCGIDTIADIVEYGKCRAVSSMYRQYHERNYR